MCVNSITCVEVEPSAPKNLMFIVLFSVLDFPQIVRVVAVALPKSIFAKSRFTLLPIFSTAVSVFVKESPAIKSASSAASFAKAFCDFSK